MRSAGAHVSMLYMPMIDLWGIETSHEASEDDRETSDAGNGMEYEFCPSAHAEGIESQTAARKASYLWTSFVEQVESIRVNSSLIILVSWHPLIIFLKLRSFINQKSLLVAFHLILKSNYQCSVCSFTISKKLRSFINHKSLVVAFHLILISNYQCSMCSFYNI